MKRPEKPRPLDVAPGLTDAEFEEAVSEGMKLATDEVEQLIREEPDQWILLQGAQRPRMPSDMVMLYLGMQLWTVRRDDEELLNAVRDWYLSVTHQSITAE